MSPSQISTATTAELVAFYNKHASTPVKKFADRKTAERRCRALAVDDSPAPAKPVTKTTAAGATVTIRPAAGAPAPAAAPANPPAAPSAKPEADRTEYTLGDITKVKRGAIFEAVSAMSKRGGTFTRPDFVAACGGEVNSMSHFYWAKRHGVIVVAE